MIYPNTQPSGVVGGQQDDNRKKLQQMLSKLGAAPLFGGSGRSASVAALPSVGAPALNFNPFLKMLAGRPGETFAQLPAGISGALAAGVQNLSPQQFAAGVQGGAVGSAAGSAAGGNPVSMNNPVGNQAQAPVDPNAFSTGYGHYNDRYIGSPGTQGSQSSQGPTSSGLPVNPFAFPALAGAGIGAAAGTMSPQSNLNPLSNASMYHTLLQLRMYGMDR